MKTYFSLILLLLLLFNGCCVYSPWRSERYICKETPSIYIGDEKRLPDNKEYQRYFVNRSFIDISLPPHNNYFHSGNSPYCIAIFAYGEKNIQTHAVIHNIEIQSNLNNELHFSNKNRFPIKAFFQQYNGGITLAHFSTECELDLDFANEEGVTIFLDIEVNSSIGSERKILKYNFVPQLEKGYFECIHV